MSKIKISIPNYMKKMRSIQPVIFYIFLLEKFIDLRSTSSGQKYKIYKRKYL